MAAADYLFINSNFQILGRESRIDYENDEYKGVVYSKASDIEEAISTARNKWMVYGVHMMPYGVRMSEEAWYIYKRLLRVRKVLDSK